MGIEQGKVESDNLLDSIFNKHGVGNQPEATAAESGEPPEQPEAEAPAKAPEPEATGIPDDLFGEEDDVEEAPAEPKPEDDEPPKDGHKWAELRNQLKEYQKKVSELEKNNTIAPEKEKEYQDRISQLEDKLGQFSVAETTAFKEQHDVPIQQRYARAVRVLEQTGEFNREQAEKIVEKASRLKFQDRQRYLMDEAPELNGVLGNLFLDIDERVEARAEAIRNHRATHKELEEMAVRKSQVESVRSVEQHLAKSFEELEAEGNFFFKESKGQAPTSQAWNREIQDRKAAIKALMLKNDSAQIAKYVADGFTARLLREDYRKLRAENAALKKQNESMKASSPRLSSSGPAGNRATKIEGDSTADMLGSIFARAGVQ